MKIVVKSINQMQVLDYIEDRFFSLSKKSKIELVLFPLLLLVLIFMLFDNKKEAKSRVADSFSFKEFEKIDFDYVKILKDIEQFCTKNHMKIISISRSENRIELEVKSSNAMQIRFIHFLENYNSFSKIETLEINKNFMNLKLSFIKNYLKRPFDFETSFLKLKKEKVLKLKLFAIVDDRININGIWLSVGGKIDDYKLIEIKPDRVLLENSFEKRWLYLNEDLQ